MRVTYNMLTGKTLNDLMISAERLMEAQDRASSGKRIHKPSDDVNGAGQAMSLRQTISSMEQYERSADMAKTDLSLANHYVNEIGNTLKQIKIIASKAGSAALSDEARDALLADLDRYNETLVALGNTKHGGKYIFAGSKSDTVPIVVDADPDPLDPNPPPYIYEGDNSDHNLTIAPGIDITCNVAGDKLFNLGGVSNPASPDVFTMISDLRENIEARDTTAISAQLADIDEAFNNITTINVQLGARINRLNSTTDNIGSSKLVYKELLSKTEDVDLSEAIVELSTRQNVYQAAIAVASKVLENSLVNFLK